MADTPTPAPFPTRTAAFLTDQAVVLIVVVVPLAVAGVDVLSPAVRTPVFLALMAVAFLYHFTLEWLTGRTLGKRAFGLEVLQDDGRRLTAWGSLLRNAARLVDGLGYWTVATAIIFYRGDGKRLGDVLGGTLVVSAG